MKIRSKFVADAFQYQAGKEEELKKWFADNKLEILKMTTEEGFNNEPYQMIYYIDTCLEPQIAEVSDSNWLWLDEMQVLNWCTDSHMKSEFEVINTGKGEYYDYTDEPGRTM